MSNYPLINKLGLKLVAGISTNWVDADELEKILAAAPIGYGHSPTVGRNWGFTDFRADTDKHQARVLLVEPIPKTDTAESLLREGLAFYDGPDPKTGIGDWIKRARRVVGNPE